MKNKRKIIYIVLPIILFTLLAIFIKAESLSGIETWFYSESVEHMSPIVTNTMKFITHIGDSTIVIGICLVLFLIYKTRRKYGVPISIAVVLSAGLNVLLKHIFSRVRPDILRLINETSYSFPSGHAMINSTLYTMIILLTLKYAKTKKTKVFVIIICSILTILIGFSRVYLGVHYITDIIGGWLLGITIAIGLFMLNKYYDEKLSNQKEGEL